MPLFTSSMYAYTSRKWTPPVCFGDAKWLRKCSKIIEAWIVLLPRGVDNNNNNRNIKIIAAMASFSYLFYYVLIAAKSTAW